MTNIIIHKLNNTYVKIECDQAIARELADYFTITVPNAQYRRIGNYKHWNGKLRLFKIREKTIYLGLIPYIEEFAKNKQYTIEYTDKKLLAKKSIKYDDLIKVIKKLDLPIEPYEHQISAVQKSLQNKRILLVSPTASGKSLIIYLLIRLLLPDAINNKQNIIIIVPITYLVEQMYGDFLEYSTNNNWDVEKYCHRIYSEYEKQTDKPILISTWQSLANMPVEPLERAYAVFGDEAHECTAKTLQRIIGSCTNAEYRVGLTGTIQDTKSHRLTLEGMFGLIYQPTTTHQLIQEKKLSPIEIKAILLKHENSPLLLNYREELEYLFFNQNRNKFIRNLVMSLPENTLLLYDFVEKHGMILKEMIDNVNTKKKKKVYLIYGKTPVEEIQKIRIEMEKENNVILLASYKKFQKGANIKNLHNIVFAAPAKSKIKVLQSIGRELRKHPLKKTAHLFDIADEICYNEKVKNWTLNHFAERIKIYNCEKFPWKIYKIQLKQTNIKKMDIEII